MRDSGESRHNKGVFPEPKPLSGKRLVPQLAVGCVAFALVGLLGTFLVGKLLAPYFTGSKDQFARQAEAREAQSHSRDGR